MQKRALITGASEGIGRAFVKKLAQENYLVTIVARNTQRLEELKREIPHSIDTIVVADLCTEEGMARIAEMFSKEHYHLLVNNAGCGMYGKFSEQPLEKILPVLRLNCEAVYILSHAFLRNAKSGDALINISSTTAFLPLAGSATYSATKSFVTALSEAVWAEELKRGVYVMNFCPGLTKTEFANRAGGPEAQPPEWLYQSSEEVAYEMYRALQARSKPTVISGKRNVFITFLTRILSRRRVVKIMDHTT